MPERDDQTDREPGRAIKLDRLELAAQAIQVVALENHMSEEMVREQLMSMILEGMSSENPEDQKRWERIPRAGEMPTPEEFIAFCSEMLGQ